ncbi:MAG: NfeD family protein [Planctomycetota bacterium]|jgi:membrane-bound serine protease (ClpP class)
MTTAPRWIALLALTLWGTVAAWGAQEATETAADEPVLVTVALEGELTRGSLSLVGRALEEARALNAVCVIELDTPGGRVDLMRQLGKQIEEARSEHELCVVAWVKHEAMSAGAYVALHCDRIAMRSGTRIGAATPILAGPMGAAPVENKMVSALRSEFRGAAEKNGYPPAIAEGMVDGELEVHWVQLPDESDPRAVTGERLDELRASGPGIRSLGRIGAPDQPIALTASEAVTYGLATEAETIDDVIADLIPRYYWDRPAVRPVEATAAEWLAQVLGTLSPLLLILGIALIWIEFQMPGIGLPAAGAAACFGLLLAGRYIAGLAGLEHVVMIVGGVVLIAVELFVVPGTFFAGITGGLLLLGGVILSATGDIDPISVPLDRFLLLQVAFNTSMWLLAAVACSAASSWILPRTPFYSRLSVAPTDSGDTFGAALGARDDSRPREDLVGRGAVALTALRPVGQIQVDGEGVIEFEAWAIDAPHDPGVRLRVVSTEGGRLRVESDAEEKTT